MQNLEKIPVAILGATGVVGQKAVALIDHHPRFYIKEIVASEKSLNKRFEEAVCWREKKKLSSKTCSLKIKRVEDVESLYVLSALPACVAENIEPLLVRKSAFVFTNASSFRMSDKVPLLIPEVNPEHLMLCEKQETFGKIIANPNCTTTFVALALHPLIKIRKIVHVSVVTMQAISGAGYLGVDSMEIMGNIIPHIAEEEEKIVRETRKILGTGDSFALFDMTVHTHRVPVLHGHSVVLHVQLSEEVELREVKESYFKQNEKWPGLYKLYEKERHPQPAFDITEYDQSVHIGRLKHGARKNMIGMIVMGHNLVRGAAGASLRNMELVSQHDSLCGVGGI